MARSTRTRDAVEILRYIVGDDAEALQELEDERANVEIARMIYEARTAAGLTQQQLAEKVGTSHSAISRLEDADYEGHSLGILRRIAAALGKGLEIRFIEPGGQPNAHWHSVCSFETMVAGQPGPSRLFSLSVDLPGLVISGPSDATRSQRTSQLPYRWELEFSSPSKIEAVL